MDGLLFNLLAYQRSQELAREAAADHLARLARATLGTPARPRRWPAWRLAAARLGLMKLGC